MKLLILLFWVTNSLAAPQGLPVFKVSGYSRSNVPEMTVTFENGVSHDMLLEPYSNSPCNFIGELKDHPSSLAVTGCLDKPGDKMHITLLSDLNTKSYLYEMDYEGHVTAEENPFKYQKEPSGIKPPSMRTYNVHDDEMGDEEEDDDMELAAMAAETSAATTWPKERYAYVKFGYENTMKAQLQNDGITFAKWIDAIMTHVQSYYRHKSLPTKIQFKYDTAETIFTNANWPSTDYLETAAGVGKADGDAKVDLYAFFGKDNDYYGTVGLAYVGGACSTKIKTSFNEWRKTPTANAGVVAHEMGHNFGMSHDFDDKHGGKTGKCNGKGIMSYGDFVENWSDCSVSDFTGYYNSRKWGTTCLASWDAYCGDDCMTTGGTCPMSAAICVNPSKYGGCTGQYKSYFDAYCKKTCGKCGKSDNGNSGQTPATKKCFDMKTTTKQYGDEISWTFGTCKSSQYKSHKVYTQKCCLAPGKYTLSCKDSYGDGWNGGYLEISGTKVCNDFTTGSEKKVTLNLSGAAGK